MKYSEIFKEKLGKTNAEDVFVYLISTLKNKITKWDYFVNWSKVFANLKNVEVELNIINYLIGKSNITEEFKSLLRNHPEIIKTIPILIASRESDFMILDQFGYNEFKYKQFTFKLPEMSRPLSESIINDVVEFCLKTGFLDLLSSKKIKNVVDYVIGIEVGLDSNGRKNRTGKIMEKIVEFFIKDLCTRNGFEYITQADSEKVKNQWGKNMTVDKSSRRIDFAILNKDKRLYLIETNFYGGGGSKLKSTAGEYKTMFDYWKKDGHQFIWITDGDGWKTTYLPLKETFDKIDYILNLDMLSRGILEDIIKGSL